MIPSKLHEVLQIPAHRQFSQQHIPEIIKSLQQFAFEERSQTFSQFYPELLRLLFGCHCSLLMNSSCPHCVQQNLLDVFGTQNYSGAQIQEFHYLNVLSPLPNLFGYFSQIQIRNLGRQQAQFSQNFNGGRLCSSVLDSQEATHFLLTRQYIQAKQPKSREDIFPQPHNIYSLAFKFQQKRSHFDNFQFNTVYLPHSTRTLINSKLYRELPVLYTSLLRNKVNNPNILNLTALEYYLFELFCTIRHQRPSYSSYLGLSKLAATHFEWNEKLVSMEYIKRVNTFIHPLTKLLLQNLLLALDLKMRKENQRILDLILALFQQFLLQTPISQIMNVSSRKSTTLRLLTSPTLEKPKQKSQKPTLVHLECIYGCLQILSSFPQIYGLVIPSVQNYVMVLLIKWNQLWPSLEKSPLINDLLPLFMKVVRPWHSNYFFSIQSLEMKTYNFKFGILNYHFKKNLGDKSLILSGLDKLKRKAKTMSASFLHRLMPNSNLISFNQKFQSDGASFIYESLKSYQEQMVNSRGGIAWLDHAKRVSFPFAMKIFPLILKSECFSKRHLSLRMIEFLQTFIEFIKPNQNGTIFDGFFSLDDCSNHLENPQDISESVLKLLNISRDRDMISGSRFSFKFKQQQDELRDSMAVRQGYRRSVYPFRVNLTYSERDQIIVIIKKFEDVKVSQQLTSCLKEVNARINTKNIKALRECADRVKKQYMAYFKVIETNRSSSGKMPLQITSELPVVKLKRSPSFGNQDEFQRTEQGHQPKSPILSRSRVIHHSVWIETAHRNESQVVLRVAKRCSFLCDKIRGKQSEEYPITNLRFIANRNLWALGGLLVLTGAWLFI